MFQLFTDTDTDITPEMAKECGYKLISMPYSPDGENNIYPYRDFEVFDAHAYYDTLRAGTLPTTSAISKEDYIGYFEPEFAAGKDVLYVHFSRAMTATFNGMDEAVSELLAKYPERKFYAVDTKAITILALNIVLAVADLVKEGKTPEEIVEWSKTEVDKYAVYFFADDLKFFKHSGRVSGLSATMGTLLGIRPIIHINEEGKMVSIGKERGRANAVSRLLAYVDELGEDVAQHRIIIGNTDAPDLVEEVRARLVEKYGDGLDLLVADVNPTAGAHCGPNAVGITFYAKHR